MNRNALSQASRPPPGVSGQETHQPFEHIAEDHDPQDIEQDKSHEMDMGPAVFEFLQQQGPGKMSGQNHRSFVYNDKYIF